MIIRVRHQTGFLVVQNSSIRDPALSLKATGLLALLLTFPDEQRFSRDAIARLKSDGVAAVRSGLKELAMAGYLRHERVQDSHGRWSTATYLHETAGRTEGWKSAFGNGTKTCENCTTPMVGQPMAENQPVIELPTTKVTSGAPLFDPSDRSAPETPEPVELPTLVSLVTDLPERAAELRRHLAEAKP